MNELSTVVQYLFAMTLGEDGLRYSRLDKTHHILLK